MARPTLVPWAKFVLFGLLASLLSTSRVLAQAPIVRNELHHDVSRPLRELAANPPTSAPGPHEADELKMLPLPPGFKPASEPDAALQKTAVAAPTELAPTVGLNFEGLGTGFPNYSVNVAPPDTNGAVGKTQYVQWVNLSFAAFDKATGNVLSNFPVPGNTLWQGFGGGCETDNDGDPIVTYDKLADRWVFTQFVVRNQPFLQCVAVSTTSDVTGTYNRYSFPYSNFNDYPKLGVWPDAYYITFNIFGQTSFLGAEACAYDRNAMLNAQVASQVCFPADPTVLGLLPADVDGLAPPPAGSPNFMLSFGVNSLKLFKFHVDFGTPANSTLTGPTSIAVTAFTPALCNRRFNCVPQPPGDGTLLDTLGDRLMYRLAYRNFGDHESLVVNHSVFADPVKLNSGVRWYEIQNPSGTPTVAQQSTFAPDTSFRWMGSVAMDISGNMAVGYSVSSATIFPSIAFAARAATDPASTLQQETNLFTGKGSQLFNLTRWGDYSAMQVDPVDDCTFWYTSEYLAQSGFFNWNTRIANFKFPNCGAPFLAMSLSHSGNFTQGQTGATYTITITNTGAQPTDATAVTVTDTLPTGLSATAAAGMGWTCPTTTGSTVSCNRTDALASGTSYPNITVTVNVAANAGEQVTNTAKVDGGGNKDFVHNTASDPTTITQNGPDLVIVKTHSGPFILGQTGIYTITVSNVGLSATDGTTVTVTDTLPSGLTFNAATGTNWNCSSAPPTVTCMRSDVLNSKVSHPPITLTVNVDPMAPALVVNSVSVSGGGDPNSETASDPTSVIPPPPDLTITKSHTANFNQGQQNAQYTLTVTNLSGGPTVGRVTVTDTLPTGLTGSFASGFGWFCSFNATRSALSCTRNSVLAVGSSYPAITLSVNVASNAPASVVNTATVSGGNDITPGNNTANDTTTVNPAPDLVIAKSHTPDPFIVGQTGTYTITVSNVGGASTAGFVNVNDSLPFGLNATSVTGNGWSCDTSNPNFVSCTRADALAAGGSYPPLTVAVSVNGGGPSVTNMASVNGGGEFNTTNDTASDLTNITGPVLAITKTHTGDFTTGVPGVYTITVSNTGPVATVGTVKVTDFLPFGMTATSVSGSGWNCVSLPASFLTCTRSDSLMPTKSYPALNVTVSITGASSSVINNANVEGGGDSIRHMASDPTNINTPILAVTKTHSGNFVVGQDGIYEIAVSNTGKAATVGSVSLQDFLPFGLTAVAAGGPGWTCGSVLPTTFLNCSRADSLAPGASYPALIVTVNVASAGATVTNNVNVTGGGDPQFRSGSDIANVSGPVLSIAKSHSGTFTAGQNGTYTINVSNTGQVATSGIVTVQDFLPFGLTAIAESGTGWTCPSQPTNFLVCTRSDSLSPGGSYPALVVTVSIATSGTVTNTANVSGGSDGAFHNASDTVTINPGPILSITKTHTGDFTAGQTGSYTITVGNTGKVATNGVVTVQDFIPFVLAATAVSGNGWNCNNFTSFLTCTRSDVLNPGSNYPALVVTVSVNGGPLTVTNSASVTGGGDSQSHFASDPTNVLAGPILGISKSHSPDPFVVGQAGTYTITVDNKAGKGPTGGTVTVQDFVSFVFSVTAITGNGWSCSTPPTNFITCTRSDSLAVGAIYPAITVTVNVNGGGPSLTNSATVTGGGDFLTHTASDTTKINGPVLAVSKTHTPDPFIAGQQGTYTITVSNTGTGATAGTVTVTDNLPIGLTLASSSGTGWGCQGTTSVTCTRSDPLAAGAGYPPLVLTVNIGNSVATIVNTASVTGGGDLQSHSANDTANVSVPLLAITKSHSGDFTAGQSGTYTIDVSNVGTVATTGTVTVTDSFFLSFGMTATAVTLNGWGCSSLPTSFLTCTRSDSLAPTFHYPALVVTVSVGNGATNFTNVASVTGGGDGLIHRAGDPTTIITNPTSTPVLAISKSHSGNFTLGQPANYTITVSNTGTVPTTGFVQLSDQLPVGLTATSATGMGWQCSSGTTFVNCNRADALPAGTGYPPITVGVNIDPNAPSSMVNQATVGGGGDQSSHLAADTTNVNFPDLAITTAHTGNFFVGETGVTYTINVNNVGSVATAGGTITVLDLLPIGLAATAASGTGWSCNIFTGPQTEVDCTRPAGVLTQGSSYPPIAVTANVAFSSPASVTNSVSVFGIDESNFANNSASDAATVLPVAISPTSNTTVTVTAGSSGMFSFQVNLATNPPAGTTSFSVTGLPPNSTVSFSPSSLAQAGSVTMTVNTSGNGHVALLEPFRLGWLPVYAALLVPAFGLLAIGMRSQQRRKWLWLGIPLCGLLLAMAFAGCGGGSGTPTATPTPSPTTPPGSYNMTVTATSPGGSASTPVTLVVQ